MAKTPLEEFLDITRLKTQPDYVSNLFKTAYSKNISTDEWNTFIHQFQDLISKSADTYLGFENVLNEILYLSNHKLDINTTSTQHVQVYGKAPDGANVMIDSTASVHPLSVVYRDAEGVASIGNPTADSHIANKHYVDEGLLEKVDKLHNTNTYTLLYAVDTNGVQKGVGATNSNLPGLVISRNSAGRAAIATPLNDYDIANKLYVDFVCRALDSTIKENLEGKLDKVTTSGGLRFYTITPTGEQALTTAATDNIAGTLMYRSNSGQTEIGTPTEASHATNKAYVDNRFVNPTSSGEFTHTGKFHQGGEPAASSYAMFDNDLIVKRNAFVDGNLTVRGTNIVENYETLDVEDAYIVTNSNGADISLTKSGVIVQLGAGDGVYAPAAGILYDPITESLSLGIGELDIELREFTFNTGEGLPIALRSQADEMVNGNFPVWDSATHSFKDSNLNKFSFISQYSQGSFETGHYKVYAPYSVDGHSITYGWHDTTEITVVDESALDTMLEEVYA